MHTYTSFQPGKIWLDTDGNPIQAHGGGILYDQGIYYWFGENKDGETKLDPNISPWHRVDVIGVSCYSSKDLLNWNYEGLVLPANPHRSRERFTPHQGIRTPQSNSQSQNRPICVICARR